MKEEQKKIRELIKKQTELAYREKTERFHKMRGHRAAWKESRRQEAEEMKAKTAHR